MYNYKLHNINKLEYKPNRIQKIILHIIVNLVYFMNQDQWSK